MELMNENSTSAKYARVRDMIAIGDDDEGGGSSFHLQQALAFSLHEADCFFSERRYQDIGVTDEVSATLAAARLGTLLECGRRTLNGRISAKDFIVLCNTFQGEIATPHTLDSLAGPVADEYGLEPDTYKNSSLAPLLDKLMEFSLLERVALRDMVERYWYSMKEYDSIEAFLRANGASAPE